MAELRVRVLVDVRLDLIPKALVIAHLLARRADGNKPTQRLNIRQGRLELDQDLLAIFIAFLLLGDHIVKLFIGLLEIGCA